MKILNQKSIKNILLGFAAISLFACNSNSKSNLDTKSDVLPTDTAGAYKANASADTARLTPIAPSEREPKKVVTESKTTTKTVKPKVEHPATTSTVTHKDTTITTTVTPAPAPVTTTDNTTATQTPAPAEKKKGWSSAAKGATIGGVGGAIGGAILSKKKGTGALIGAAVGAAGGYIIGRKKDKKAADTITTK